MSNAGDKLVAIAGALDAIKHAEERHAACEEKNHTRGACQAATAVAVAAELAADRQGDALCGTGAALLRRAMASPSPQAAMVQGVLGVAALGAGKYVSYHAETLGDEAFARALNVLALRGQQVDTTRGITVYDLATGSAKELRLSDLDRSILTQLAPRACVLTDRFDRLRAETRGQLALAESETARQIARVDESALRLSHMFSVSADGLDVQKAAARYAFVPPKTDLPPPKLVMPSIQIGPGPSAPCTGGGGGGGFVFFIPVLTLSFKLCVIL